MSCLTVDEDGEWMKAGDEDEDIYKYSAEYAKSSRARCRVCSEAIQKGTVRVGYPIKWGGGTHGYINSWKHLICARAAEDDDEQVVADDVYGITDLDPADQALLLGELAKKGLPTLIKKIDPNDPEFLKRREFPVITQPAGVILKMLPYQLEGLAFLVNSEHSSSRGGILADEMGMGKTLQAIALIVATQKERGEILQKVQRLEGGADSACTGLANPMGPSESGGSVDKANGGKLTPNSIGIVTPPRKIGKKERLSATTHVEDDENDNDDDDAFTPKSKKSLTKVRDKRRQSKRGEESNGIVGTGLEVNLSAMAHIKPLPIDETGPTLVVCPSSAMMQWRDEMKRCTKEGTLRVFVFYQNRKKLRQEDLLKCDVILTTYAVLENEYRTQENKQKEACEYCKKLYLPRKLELHLKYFCGPHARRTVKQQKTERTKIEALEKAKATLKITKRQSNSSAASKKKRKNAMPTPSAIYRELMQEANREVMPQYVSSKKKVSDDHKVLSSNEPKSLRRGKWSSETKQLTESVQVSAGSSPGGDVSLSLATSVAETNGMESPKRRLRRKAAKTSPYFPKAERNRSKSSLSQHDRQTPQYIDDDDDNDDNDDEWSPKAPPPKTKKSLPSDKRSRVKSRTSKKLKKVKQSLNTDEETSSCNSTSSSEGESTESGNTSSSSEDDDQDLVDHDGVSLKKSLLHRIKWKRVILDEAHKIKGRTNNTAKSVYALRASFRTAITGTPLQNRVSELYALIRFLKFAPHSYYFCQVKGCDCISLHWEFGPQSRKCSSCNHPPMRHFSYFNKYIMNPISRYGYIGDGRKGMLRLKNQVLDKVMLRRTKVERESDIKLPPLIITVEKLVLTESETDFYECIYKNSRSKFDTFVEKGVLLNNYAHIFQLLSRLRQTLDHPYLVVHGNFDGGRENIPSRSASCTDVCGICGYDIARASETVLSACHHTFHRGCLSEYTDEHQPSSDHEEDGGKKRKKKKKDSGKNPIPMLTCPVCFVPLTVQLEVRGMDETSDTAIGFHTSDPTSCIVCMDRKRDALLVPCGHIYTCMECTKTFRKRKNACPICREPIKKVVQANTKETARNDDATGAGCSSQQILLGKKSIVQQLKMNDFQTSTKVEAVLRHIQSGAEKSIIFSQYNRMIDIVEWRLKNAGVNVVKLVGSMSLQQRSAVLQAFKTDAKVRVILMSLRAGGEGLNLQEATHVFVLEPWWNPAVEMQAINRAHRIGQTKPVHAVRFITENTVEERMLELQEKKQLVFQGTVDSSAMALSQLTADDLQFLFR